MTPPAASAPDALFGTLHESERSNLLRLMAEPTDPALCLRNLHVRSLADPRLGRARRELFADAPGDLPIAVLCLENAIVTPRGFVIHADDLLWDATYINPGWALGVGSSAIPDVFNGNGLWRYDPLRRAMLFAEPPQIDRVDTDCFLFNSETAMGNFAHFMHDTMLQVPTFRELAVREAVTPLFVGDGFRLGATRDLLGWCLGRPERDWFYSRSRFLQVRRLYVPLPHVDFATNRISVSAARRMRASIATALGPIPAAPATNLYISRADSSGLRFDPHVANVGPFRQLLSELRIAEIKVSDLGGQDYFALFKGARIVLGLHGAGLLNVLLAADGRLVELAVPLAGGSSLTLVTEAAGIPTTTLLHANAHVPEVEIDLDAVREAVRRFA